jgi:hypothetical protein
MHPMVSLVVGVMLLMTASLADAKAVSHAVRSWHMSKMQHVHVLSTFLFFALSVTPFVYSIRYFGMAGIISRQVQALIWFLGTILFVAILDGSFFSWKRVDQIVAGLVVAGMAWLTYRVA